MDKYREHVRACSEQGRTGPSEVIFNRSPAHASIIMEHLFEVATKKVDILTGYLNRQVYGTDEVLEAASRFLQRQGTMIRILLEQPTLAQLDAHPLLRRIGEVDTNIRLEMRNVPTSVQQLYTYHFAVADDMSFRMEGDRNDMKAFARFGDSEFGAMLASRFEEIWGMSAA